MTDIKFDKRNYRKHNEKNKELINNSLKELGAGRSILIDANNEIIAGNGVYEQAQSLGLKTKIVETDGNELVVVKRLDLKTIDEKRKKLAIMDNSTSDTSEFDLGLLSVDFNVVELGDLGIDFETLENIESEMPILSSAENKIYQQMTFTLSTGQVELIKEALTKAQKTPNFEFVDKMGNENSNGNALYFIIREWLNGQCKRYYS